MKTWKLNPNPIFKSCKKKHGKEIESDGIDVLEIKLNNTVSSISPSSFHVNKDENVSTGVMKKHLHNILNHFC